MPSSTITEAVADMRLLQTAGTGRLSGLPARHISPATAARRWTATPQPWLNRLLADLTARAAGTVTPASAEYIAWTDATVIAVLTADAHLALPDYPLTSIQARHQDQVIEALSDLPRSILRTLADQRSTLDGRNEQLTYEAHPPAPAAIRIAAADEPTVTHWIDVSGDLPTDRETIHRLGLDPDQVIIISAPEYGKYGLERHRLQLSMLEVMQRLSTTHAVPLRTVGNWLDAEGATNEHVDPARIEQEFGDAYIGPFEGQQAFTRHHIAELGWLEALHQAGIPEHYLDLRIINWEWFTTDYRGIVNTADHRLEVFRRTQHR